MARKPRLSPAKRARGATGWLVVGSLLAGVAVTVTGSLQSPTPDGIPQAELGEPVPVEIIDPQGADLAASGYADDGHVWQPPTVTWPRAGVARAAVDGVPRMVKGTVVSLASTDPVGDVEVETFDRGTTAALGIDGVLVRVDAAAPGEIRLGLDYRSFEQAYGGGWASRLSIVQLTDCAGGPATCRTRTPLESGNDFHGAVSATVPSSGFFALTATAGSDSGDFAATDLAAAGSWSAGGNSGGFSYDYPLRTPPASGPVPALGLHYSSSSHDGRTSGSNNQASWIGDGWTYEPGYVERSYKSCASDQDGGNNATKTGDQCWDGDSNAITISLNGVNTSLVRDDTTGAWRTADDKDWRIEKLGSPATSSTATSEYWRVTMTDGTQYTFGPSANSRWTVPVFGNHTGEKCHATAFADSRCEQAYRWQVEKAVDVHGNQASYTYGTETGYYGAGGDKDKRVSYIRDGWLSRIDYGLRSDNAAVTPTGRVVFDVADRCLTDCGTAPDSPKTENWPDTPWDLQCKAAPCTDQTSPAFFSAKRLATITTQVASGTGFKDVDRWTLTHEFKDYGDKSQVVMWLKSIQHTGLANGGSIPLPPTTFEGQSLPNRVDTRTGIPAVWRSRVSAITTETGGVIGVKYSDPDCSATDLPSAAESNTRLCYPVWWTPEEYWEVKKDWFRKYVVKSIVEQDTTAKTVPTTTTYEYATTGGGTDVLWAWDEGEFTDKEHRTYGEWRGYAQVTTKVGDPTEGPTLNTRTSYYRGLDGQRLPSGTRTVKLTDSEGNQVADHEALAGSVFETAQLDGTVIDSATVSKYWTKNTASRAHDGGTLKAWMTGESEKTTRKRLTATAWQRTKVEIFYDDHGRVLRSDNSGDLALAGDESCTRREYGGNETAWLMAAAYRVETVSVACSASPNRPTDVVSDVRSYFDGSAILGTMGARGLITRTETLDSWSNGPVYLTTGVTTYDALGRKLTGTDALNRVTVSTVYTPSGPGPLTATKVTNALGHATTTELDPSWGAKTAIVDPNNRRTDTGYDALGRKTALWLPGQSKAAGKEPHLKFAYTISNSAPSTVTTQKLTPRLTYVTSVVLFDSLLRQVQTQADTAVGGRVLGETDYNTRGEKKYVSGPNYDSTAKPNGTLSRVEQGADHARNVYAYDGLGRVIREEFWSKNIHRWDTTTVYGGSDQGFLTVVTPPNGAARTGTLTNASDQAIEQRQYRADGTFAATRYTYTPAGDMSTAVDPVGNTWSFDYDLRHRRTRATDPDTGTSTMAYDAAGQLTSVTDARGVKVSSVYDKLGRVTSTWAGSPDTGTKLTEFTFDTVTDGLGLPAEARSFVGGKLAVTNRVGKYDVAGRVTQHYTDIAATPGLEKLAGSYLYTTVYAVDGQLGGMGLGAYGGLSAESIAYGYSAAGLPTRMVGTSVSGDQVYVDAVSYTAFGESAQRTLGPAGGHVYQTSTYEDGTRRRRTFKLSKDGSPATTIADLSYDYDDAGNITTIGDAAGGERQCFAYDDLRRLTEAWAQGGTGDCAAQPSKAVLGGPAPYWSSYTHDITGNRTSETKHTVNEDATYTYSYPNPGAPGAHRVSEVTHGPVTDTYKSDTMGNLLERKVGGKTETLTWDESGELTSTTDSTGTTRMVYDADGNRVARIDANGDATVYAAQNEVTYTAATGAVTALRSYIFGGDTVATKSTKDGLVWTTGDHHGTATWTVAAATMAVTVRREDPYGNSRGEAVVWNAGQRGFVGGVNDPNGLVTIGARSYDPRLGRFISADPVVDFADPQQMNGYTYSNANPITASDPSGMKYCYDENCSHYVQTDLGGRPIESGDGSEVIGILIEYLPNGTKLERHSDGKVWINGIPVNGGKTSTQKDVDPSELARYVDEMVEPGANSPYETILPLRAACFQHYNECGDSMKTLLWDLQVIETCHTDPHHCGQLSDGTFVWDLVYGKDGIAETEGSETGAWIASATGALSSTVAESIACAPVRGPACSFTVVIGATGTAAITCIEAKGFTGECAAAAGRAGVMAAAKAIAIVQLGAVIKAGAGKAWNWLKSRFGRPSGVPRGGDEDDVNPISGPS